MDAYYSRPEVSNSDLTALKNYLEGGDHAFPNQEQIFYFGNLIDAMLTEKNKINISRKTFDDAPVDPVLFNKALKMKLSFLKDDFCNYISSNAKTQTVFVDDVHLEVGGFPFFLTMRSKLDFDLSHTNLICDLKSTSATSQSQFLNSVHKFDYDRQAVVYMSLARVSRFAILGVSKINQKIFKIFVEKDSELYESGMEKFKSLALKWYLLFN